MDAPAAREAVSVSSHVVAPVAPSRSKPTPSMVPAGVGPVPWFFTTAVNTIWLPTTGLAGEMLTLVTIRSGNPGVGVGVGVGFGVGVGVGVGPTAAPTAYPVE